MDSEGMKFGRGPREMNGAVDLISQYRLSAHHAFFCKKPLPLALSDSHYLHNIAGDRQIQKGEGMELDQLLQNRSNSRGDKLAYLLPFDLETLGRAAQMRQPNSVDFRSAENGLPTVNVKSNVESNDKEQKHKRHKETDKDKEHKKHKHSHKERSKEKEKVKERERKDRSGHHDSGSDSLKRHHEKKGKLDGQKFDRHLPPQ